MKRPNNTSSSKPKASNRFEEFLVDLMAKVNQGIHDDLGSSEDWLARHEIDEYLTEHGLDVGAIEANEELTVHQVLEIGIHFSRYNLHKNWHESMEVLAKKYGADVPEGFEHGKRGKMGVEVITDVSQLPDEVKEVLTDVLTDMLKKKKGKK